MRQPVPFGKYLLLDRVSVGGMAEVFKAKSYGVEGFEKIIAIKRILPSMGEDRDFIKMFIDEAKIVGQLAHANICQIFELGRIDGTHFIAMEYIWGKDVLQIQNRLRKKDQVMAVAMACHIISKVCEGLDYAHRKRDPMGNPIEIVHRDCSPQNVLISYEGEVKIIDFGIAKAASRSSRTMAGVLKGKFGYMSPEQVRGLPLDRRSDIFALGTVLYEMLTCERLFQAESDFSTLEKVRNVDIEPPRSVNRNIPEEVEAIVMKALAADPEDRYQWCSEMHADLQRFLMSQEAVFTSKMLSAWMKDTFSAELTRERKLMEEYKKVGRDGNALVEPKAKPKPQAAESLLDDAPSEAEATMLGGPNFEDILGGPLEEIEPEILDDDDDDDDDGDDFAEEAPTEIFGELDHQVPGKQAASSGAPGNPPRAAPNAELHKANTLLQPSGSAMAQGAPRGPSRLMPVQAPPPEPAYDLPDSGASRAASLGAQAQNAPYGFTSSMPAQPASSPAQSQGRRGRSPSLAKDIGIGFGIAVLVLGLFVGVKFLFFSKSNAATIKTGTIAVALAGNESATVLLNGQSIGSVQGGQPITVQQVPLGAHVVTVTRPGVEPCERPVTLAENAPAAQIECQLRVLTGQLVLEGLTPEHTVTLDGKPVPGSELTKPLDLPAGGKHEVAITLGDQEVTRFDVILDPGQTLRHALPSGDEDSDVAPPGDGGSGDSPPGDEGSEQGQAAQGDEGEANDDPEAKDEDKRDPAPASSSRTADQTRRAGSQARNNGSQSSARQDNAQDKSQNTSKPGKASEPAVGYLVANTQPWAQVYIDGRNTGKTTPIAPRSKIPLEPGGHKVTFVYKGQRFDYKVTIKPGQTFKLVKTLPLPD